MGGSYSFDGDFLCEVVSREYVTVRGTPGDEWKSDCTGFPNRYGRQCCG